MFFHGSGDMDVFYDPSIRFSTELAIKAFLTAFELFREFEYRAKYNFSTLAVEGGTHKDAAKTGSYYSVSLYP